MTKRIFSVSAAALAFVMLGEPATAHHSASAEFDVLKVIPITGVLTKAEILNPHSWLYLDVKGADGKVTPWRLESLSPSGLIRQGLKWKQDVKVGNTYTFTIYPALKDGAGWKLGLMRSITFNGKEYILNDI